MSQIKSSGYYSGCTCSSGFFLGASRTYYWLATSFDDWCKALPNNLDFINPEKSPCYATLSQYNQCLVKTDGMGSEQFYTFYYHYMMTDQIASCSYVYDEQAALAGRIHPCYYLVNWRDTTALNVGSALAYYPCFIGSFFCGPKSALTNDFTDRVVNYYGYPTEAGSESSQAYDDDLIFDQDGDLAPFARDRKVVGKGTDPYPYEGFIYDIFGMVGQGPASIIGQSSALCKWCFGGLFPPCVDEWFTWRGFTSTVFTWDITLGVPYWHPKRIQKFYNENSFEDADIKSNHMADEQIFFTGSANWNDGIIQYRGELLYGDLINPVSGQEIGFESLEDGKRFATITNGIGKRGYVLGLGGIGVASDVVKFNDIAVINKDCNSRSGIKEYSWIFVDIPENLTVEYQQGLWTQVQLVPSDSLLSRALYGLSPWDFYGVGIKTPVIGGSFHYRKYTKKIIKAPHNLYIKSGEYTFKECKFGENLKNLEPGRYYFPNMCYGCIGAQNLGIYNPKRYYKSTVSDYQTDTSDIDFVRKFGGLPLIQFVNEDNQTDLVSKFINATGLLGLPWASGVKNARMEDVPMYSQFKSIEQFLSEVTQLTNFISSIGSPGYPNGNFDLLPKPSQPG